MKNSINQRETSILPHNEDHAFLFVLFITATGITYGLIAYSFIF